MRLLLKSTGLANRDVLALLLTLVLCLLLFSVVAASEKEVIKPFDYKGVTLDDGPLKRQFDEVQDYYLRIPNDDLLKPFRVNAGLPAPGVDLGGWYSEGTFHVFGQIISGLSRMYAASHDIRCKEKADYLVSEWSKCIRSDGYFFGGNPNAPHYIYDKMVGGLVDDYLYCGNRDALTHLSKTTDWAIKNLDRTNAYGYGFTEWYTLSENLYRAYLATGDEKYKGFAQVWEYTDYWNIYAENGDILQHMPQNPPYYHAYSHVNALGGLGAAYLAKGEPRYLRSLKNAYDYLQKNQVWPTGGFGPNENLLPRSQLVDTLKTSHNHFETQCGSWAGFKLSRYLISFTGDAKYGDWIERLVINGIGASIPQSADGKVFYYSDYNIDGGQKRNIDIQWSCCTGTGPIAAADFHNIIYFKDASNLYINLYTPSTVRWSVKGRPVTISQKTLFPESHKVDVSISVDQPLEFGIRLRMPGWLQEPAQVSVNGKMLAVHTDARHWVSIKRKWSNGDRLSITLPMKFWKWIADPSVGYPVSVLYGPVVMAARSEAGNPGLALSAASLDTALVKSRGESLTYHLASDSKVLLRPFYAFKEGEPYFVFFGQNKLQTYTDVSHNDLNYNSDWSVSTLHYSKTANASAEYSFQGTGVTLRYGLFDDAGKAQVSIDGNQVAEIDLYGSGRDIPASWEHKGLPEGTHTIKIVVLGQKNPASVDNYVNISGLRIWK